MVPGRTLREVQRSGGSKGFSAVFNSLANNQMAGAPGGQQMTVNTKKR